MIKEYRLDWIDDIHHRTHKMKKNQVQNIIIHIPNDFDYHALSDKMSRFHVDVIERKLNQSNLSTKQKIDVINKIITNFRSAEI